MSSSEPETGPYVIASVEQNNTGHDVYLFGAKPYVHRARHGAEQEARRLARRNEKSFAVFRKVFTVECEVEVNQTPVLDAEELAGSLARVMQENDRHLSIESARYLVDAAIKECAR